MCIKGAFYPGRNHLHPSLFLYFFFYPKKISSTQTKKRLHDLSSYSLMLVGTIAIASGNGVVKWIQ